MKLQQHLDQLGLDAEAVFKALPAHLTLSLEDGVLSLCQQHKPQAKLIISFTEGALSYRSAQHLGGEHLVKACRIKNREHVSVLDATCGMGTDSYLLHCAGFAVTACEQNPLIHALLSDGIRRYEAVEKRPCFELFCAPAETQFKQQNFDVIYLDPMFPAKQKTAKNKKGMQLFQSLHADAGDGAKELLNLALAAGSSRVVIKRPSKSPLLTSHKPTFQISGKTCRFDVYHQT